MTLDDFTLIDCCTCRRPLVGDGSADAWRDADWRTRDLIALAADDTRMPDAAGVLGPRFDVLAPLPAARMDDGRATCVRCRQAEVN